MTTQLCLLGMLAGLGLCMVVGGLSRRRRPLALDMAAYDPARMLKASAASPATTARSPMIDLGRRLEALTERQNGARRSQDLAVTARSPERHAATTALCAVAGLGAPMLLILLALAGGWHVSFVAGLALCGVGLAGGVLGPGLELRRAAAESRAAWLHSFSCWLELVALAQAGGMGIEGALEAASRISPDPAFKRLGLSLGRSRHSATTPWEEIGRLGNELGIDELGELAASLGLAGMEGARIRSSLQAKSVSLRRREMSEALSRANSTTERLFLPSIVLMLGFLVFIMYPAAVSLTRVL